MSNDIILNAYGVREVDVTYSTTLTRDELQEILYSLKIDTPINELDREELSRVWDTILADHAFTVEDSAGGTEENIYEYDIEDYR